MSCVPLRYGCPDAWTWDAYDKSADVKVQTNEQRTAIFHPEWSNGTAAVRGTKILNYGRHYWEIKLTKRVFGTSMMFGVGTVRARLHVDAFVNLLGEDDQSWGLSHKGLLWHEGKSKTFTKSFQENEQTTIGLLFDWSQGTLSYFKDGVSLGVGFTGLNSVTEDLFPIISSTAAKTEMALGVTTRNFYNLQDRCRAKVVETIRNEEQSDQLPLPNRLKEYINDSFYT